MGRPFKQYLDGPRIYSCSTCRSHVADHDDIISKVHGTALACSMTCSFTILERFRCICIVREGASSTALSWHYRPSKGAMDELTYSAMCKQASTTACVACDVMMPDARLSEPIPHIGHQKHVLSTVSSLAQGQCDMGPEGGAAAHHRRAHGRGHLLHVLQHRARLEIRGHPWLWAWARCVARAPAMSVLPFTLSTGTTGTCRSMLWRSGRSTRRARAS